MALAAGAAVTLVVGMLAGGTTSSQAAGSQPCDIYGAGGTPCVAAHITTRALYAAYNGPLYQVRRSSDSTVKDIGVLSAEGPTDAGYNATIAPAGTASFGFQGTYSADDSSPTAFAVNGATCT